EFVRVLLNGVVLLLLSSYLLNFAFDHTDDSHVRSEVFVKLIISIPFAYLFSSVISSLLISFLIKSLTLGNVAAMAISIGLGIVAIVALAFVIISVFKSSKWYFKR